MKTQNLRKNDRKIQRSLYRFIPKVVGLIAVLVSILLVSFFIWISKPYKPDFNIQTFIEANPDISITISNEDIVITPKKDLGTKQIGIIFYPGGLIEPEAYIKLCARLSKEGYWVVIPKMPFNLAIFEVNKAKDVMKKFQGIEKWVIGGHSLGGAMAVDFYYKNPEKIAGIFLLASYPQKKHSLANRDISVILVYGSKDGAVDKLKKNIKLLPKSAQVIEIPGGNHAQFGNYGIQKGDREAEISAEEQQRVTVNYLIPFLKSLESNN